MYEASMLKAIDELIKSIEESQDEAQARKALDQYQRHYSTLDRPWDHVNFMYGLGLIYMHFNAYSWAIKAFREVIYVQPNFARSRDVHTRLGLIFKAIGRYKLSEKHFELAINDKRPNSGFGSKFELDFHLAHLYEIQGKLKQAKEAYERLLQEKDLPQQLSANINRQLGWMYFYTDLDASSATPKPNNRKQNMFNHQNALSNDRMDAALNYLNLSYRTDSDPKTSYYLGRCFTNIGEYHRAFDSYRSVLDREESTADTWCSIGVLYHRQNQPTDALQAYIRSVQFDKQHTVAWMNLGILYENHHQFNDALNCYQHALRSSSDGIDRSLQARIRYIKKQMAEIEMLLSNNGKSNICPAKLLSLEDLWNFESRTGSESSTNHNNLLNNPSKPVTLYTNNINSPTSNATITTQQSNTLLKNTQAHSLANDQYSNGVISKNHDSPIVKKEGLLNNNCANKLDNSTELDSKYKQPPTDINPICPVASGQIDNHGPVTSDCKVEISIQSEQDLKSKSGTTKDFSLNQLSTNGVSKDSGISSNSSTYTEHSALVPSQNTNIDETDHKSADHVIDACKNSPKPRKIDINLRTDEEEPPNAFLKHPPYPPLPPDKLFPSPPSIFLETKKDLASKRLQECCQSNSISIVRNIASVLKLDLGLFSTKTLVESNPDHHVDVLSHLLHQSGEDSDEPNANLWSCERQKSSSTICRYASYQVASFRESIQGEIESKSCGSKTSLAKESETDSNESASAKRLNTNNQTATPSHINTDPYSNITANTSNNINNSTTTSTSTTTTVNNNNSNTANANNQASNHASNSGSKSGSATKKFKKEAPKTKYVKFATEIDLSDDKKWRPQLSELNKLPSFIKCVSAYNMLTHVGATIPGLNTILMSMHVPGCRILGNETPNNICTISINVGPGDYEWCAISAEYEQVLSRLCNRNGFELEEKNWWPKIADLQKYNIPIYRFSQRPGDLVWINSGTIYWVQAVGWCNKIHWNVGPLSAKQYKSASESVELNKFLFRKSFVPMIQLTWNIVININLLTDEELFDSITDVLRRSLKYCVLVMRVVEESNQEIQLQSLEASGPKTAKFCSLCEAEVFNIYFIRKDDEFMHCFECARRSDPSIAEYRIEQGYELKYLMNLYDNFIETKRKFQTRQRRLDERQVSQQRPQQQPNHQ